MKNLSSFGEAPLLAVALLCCWKTSFAAPPNIVMIISDDHARTDYGFMGHPTVKTPNIDRLALNGLCFRGFTSPPACSSQA